MLLGVSSTDQAVFDFAEGAQSGSPYQQQPLSTLEANPFEGKAGKKPSAEVQRDYFKLRLMECIAGLDRGFAANSYAAMQVESAALALTEQSQPVMLSWTAGESCASIACVEVHCCEDLIHRLCWQKSGSRCIDCVHVVQPFKHHMYSQCTPTTVCNKSH